MDFDLRALVDQVLRHVVGLRILVLRTLVEQLVGALVHQCRDRCSCLYLTTVLELQMAAN